MQKKEHKERQHKKTWRMTHNKQGRKTVETPSKPSETAGKTMGKTNTQRKPANKNCVKIYKKDTTVFYIQQ